MILAYKEWCWPIYTDIDVTWIKRDIGIPRVTLANLRSITITLSSAARRVLSSIQSRFGKPFLKDARIASIISVACNHKIWRKALILCAHNCSGSEKDKASLWFPCQFLDFLTWAKTGKLQIASGQFQLDDSPWKPHVKIGSRTAYGGINEKKKQLGLFMFPPSPITQQNNKVGYIFFIL